MPTQSFYEMLEIDTPEKAKRLARAFEEADARGTYQPKTDILKEFEEGKKQIRTAHIDIPPSRATLRAE